MNKIVETNLIVNVYMGKLGFTGTIASLMIVKRNT